MIMSPFRTQAERMIKSVTFRPMDSPPKTPGNRSISISDAAGIIAIRRSCGRGDLGRLYDVYRN